MSWLKVLDEPVSVFVSSGDYLSFTNSPYPPHIVGRAVDIYSSNGYMPAEKGVVKKMIRFPTPINRDDAQGMDYLIIIDVGGGYSLKILHVEPSVKVGEKLRLGDYIGELIVSGYMMPWSSKHMHVEVRRAGDEVRALGSVRESPSEELIKELKKQCTTSLRVTVDNDLGTYLEASAPGQLCVDIEGAPAALDAGTPHYGLGGAVCLGNCPSYGVAGIGGFHIGEVVGNVSGVAVMVLTSAVRCGNAYLGLGTYLLTSKVKLIPLSSDRPGKGTVCTEVVPYPSKLPRWFGRADRWFRPTS